MCERVHVLYCLCQLIWHFLLYAAKSNPIYRVRKLPKSLMNREVLLGCWQMTPVRKRRGDIADGMSLITRDFHTKIENNCL